jgi:type IV secretory pathway VirB10-like protein
MAKDPFQELPSLEPESEPERSRTSMQPETETPADVAASAPPRNLLKTVSKWAVPVFVGGILIWMFYTPDTPNGARRVTAEKVEVDTNTQTSQSAQMFNGMKTEAAKPKPAAVVPVMPGSPVSATYPSASTGSPSGPLPPGTPTASRYSTSAPAASQGPQGYTPAGSPGYAASSTAYSAQGRPTGSPMPTAMSEEAAKEAQQRMDAFQKRQEDIRAAPLEAGQVRLMSQPGATDAAKTPSLVADLQADVANDRAAAAARSQATLQEQMLAALTPKEQPKSRGGNEDFMANAAASAGSRAQAAALQAPAGRYLVGEGTIIRAVLQTNVNSDLPGRVLVRTTSDVFDSTQKHLVIPKGSVINGLYNSQVAVGQARLLMAMSRLTLPNGNWISLMGAGATDMMGTSGLNADVDNHFMKMFSSSLIIGASSLLLPRADTSVTTLPGNTGNNGTATVGSLFATTLSDVVKMLLDRNRNIAPTLSLKAGEEFIFVTNQDMMMMPYQ